MEKNMLVLLKQYYDSSTGSIVADWIGLNMVYGHTQG